MKYFEFSHIPLNQWKCFVYRAYLNVFSIFFRIKLVPLGIHKYGISFYYKGDTVIWKYPWKRKSKKEVWISEMFSGTGKFGDVIFPSLKSMDEEVLRMESYGF